MKIKSIIAGVAIAASVLSASAATVWTYSDANDPKKAEGLTYTLTGQEVDFDTWAFNLNISGINVAGLDNKGGRTVLQDFGLSKVAGFVSASLPGATTLNGGLSAADGCNGNGASQFCFSDVDKAVSGSVMSIDFTIDAPTANFLTYVPHLKVDWFGTNSYSLLSDNMVAAVPEPETYALMLAGLGAVTFVARRRKLAGR